MGHFGMGARLAALAALLASPLSAQDVSQSETVVGEEGFASPTASLAQMDWLVGAWAGDGVRGAPATESWTAPVGDTMVGTFIQTNGEGEILFTELMYISQVEDSLVLRLKHFNPDMTSWEEKDEVQTYPLVQIEECAALFQGLTIRCADRDAPGEGLVVAVRAGVRETSEIAELVFTYRPASGSRLASYACDGTTFEINACLAAIRDRALELEERYFEAAIKAAALESARMTPLETGMRQAHAAAREMRSKECGAVYEHWKEGTIRNAMALRCEIRLINARTHTIWQNWLTYQDSSAPVLPEPKPTQ